MLTIFDFKLEVASPCQNDCELCAHADLMQHIKGYQLSLENLDKFLGYTERSNYFIRSLSIHGPGEPTLWRHLEEGLARIRRSKAIGWVTMVTNGLLVDKITDDVMSRLDRLFVSVYSNYNRENALKELQVRHGSKVSCWDGTFFWDHRSGPATTAPIPAACSCSGPMLYDDKIFTYCGPPVFGAAKAKGVDILHVPQIWVPLGPNYMQRYDEKLIGRMDICRHCWANANFQGRWRKNDPRKKFADAPTDAIRRVIPAAGREHAPVAPVIQ